MAQPHCRSCCSGFRCIARDRERPTLRSRREGDRGRAAPDFVSLAFGSGWVNGPSARFRDLAIARGPWTSCARSRGRDPRGHERKWAAVVLVGLPHRGSVLDAVQAGAGCAGAREARAAWTATARAAVGGP